MYNLTQSDYDKLQSIINKIAIKNGFNFQDFLSYCHEKITVCCKKFDRQKSNSFINYCATHLKLYALNYRRDCLYPSSVPRKILSDYVEFTNLKKKGWSSEAISHKIGIPLKQILLEIDKLQNFSIQNMTSLTGIEYQI